MFYKLTHLEIRKYLQVDTRFLQNSSVLVTAEIS